MAIRFSEVLGKMKGSGPWSVAGIDSPAGYYFFLRAGFLHL
ncbi:MAG: hypothetical protein ACLVHE_08395 [Dialister invisus]